MVKISAELRERLLGQSREIKRRDSIFIRNKDITRLYVRILPMGANDLPGVRYVGYYSDQLSGERKSCVSPQTYGRPCPIDAALKQLLAGADKAQKARIRDVCSKQTEYWVKVVDRDDEGTPEDPHIRILQSKQAVYADFIRPMTVEDEAEAEDVTDPQEGCDFIVQRKGSGMDTEWSTVKQRTSPLHADDAMYDALLAASANVDVTSLLPKVDWEALGELYEMLTGETIPAQYVEEFGDADSESGVSHEASEETAEEETAAEEAPAEELPVEEASPRGDDLLGATVEFTVDGELHRGVVAVTETGSKEAVVRVGDDEWDVPVDELTVVEPESEPEPEEVAPAAPRTARRAAVSVKPPPTKVAAIAKKPAVAAKPPVAVARKPIAAAKPVASVRKPIATAVAPAKKPIVGVRKPAIAPKAATSNSKPAVAPKRTASDAIRSRLGKR